MARFSRQIVKEQLVERIEAALESFEDGDGSIHCNTEDVGNFVEVLADEIYEFMGNIDTTDVLDDEDIADDELAEDDSET